MVQIYNSRSHGLDAKILPFPNAFANYYFENCIEKNL
jgi:hypothetical protein